MSRLLEIEEKAVTGADKVNGSAYTSSLTGPRKIGVPIYKFFTIKEVGKNSILALFCEQN